MGYLISFQLVDTELNKQSNIEMSEHASRLSASTLLYFDIHSSSC